MVNQERTFYIIAWNLLKLEWYVSGCLTREEALSVYADFQKYSTFEKVALVQQRLVVSKTIHTLE